MDELLASTVRALRSLLSPGMPTIIFLSVLLTAALLGFLATGSTWLVNHFTHSFSYTLLTGGGALFFAWALFPGIMPVIICFFDNRIATLIEQDEYAAHVATYEPEFWPEFFHDVRFTLKALALNIVLFPFIFLPVFGQVVYYGMNGYLLGGEFFVMVARRHMKVELASALRRKYSRIITLGGVLLVFCATIPIANLFAPFWGIALMTHLFHKLNFTPQSNILPPL